MSREFHIFASAQSYRFIVKGIGDGHPREFPSLSEATRHARTETRKRGLVLICSYCHRAGGDANYWDQIDAYLMQDSNLRLSHGVCEDCFDVQVRNLGLSLHRRPQFTES